MVAVQKAQVTALSRTLELTGTATPTRQARLASPGEGPIQNCRVREGDQVKRGERVLTIGRSGAAAAQVTAMAESLKEQQAELNRTKILVQSGAIPGSQLDTARANMKGPGRCLPRPGRAPAITRWKRLGMGWSPRCSLKTATLWPRALPWWRCTTPTAW